MADPSERLWDLLIVGAGPAGLECALAARERGLDCALLEAGRVGEHVRRWGFVRMFTPWAWNLSARAAQHTPSLPADERPTGHEFVERYLLALARSEPLRGRLFEGTRVRHIAREALRKDQAIGDPARARRPFRLLCAAEDGREHSWRARTLVDASGVYGQPRWLGSGGIPAHGEVASSAWIARSVEPLPAQVEGRLAVVGGGYSALTMLEQCVQRDCATDWLLEAQPTPPVPDDPLPGRRALAELGQRLLAGEHPHVRVLPDRAIVACRAHGLALGLETADGAALGPYARVYAMTGYRPDLELLQELQYHACYATEGPMKLAAALLAQSGGGDCLAIGDSDAEALRNPEPGLFVIGAKSYGRNGDFLLARLGAQIDAVLSMVQVLCGELDSSRRVQPDAPGALQ